MGQSLNAPFPKKFKPIFNYCPVIVSTNYKGGVEKPSAPASLAKALPTPISRGSHKTNRFSSSTLTRRATHPCAGVSLSPFRTILTDSSNLSHILS